MTCFPFHFRWLFGKLALLAFLVSCLPGKETPKPPAVLAFVNGTSIKEDLLRFYLDREKAEYGNKIFAENARFNSLKKNILNRLIRDRVILDWGMMHGIMLTEEELAEGMKGLKSGYSEREFEMMLEERKIPVAMWRDRSAETLHVQKIIRESLRGEVRVDKNEIAAYYRSHIRDFKTSERVKARHIVTDSPEKAQNIRERILKGDNFAKIAIMHSLSPDRSNGGELDYFSKSTHPEEFDICFTLAQGEVSPVIKSPYGYHIFKLIDKKPAGVLSPEEAGPGIATLVLGEKLKKSFDPWYAKISSSAQIRIIEAGLDKIRPY